MMDIGGLLACTGCSRSFQPDDEVIVTVPYREQGVLVVMGDELLLHSACEPLPAGHREIGRGRYHAVLEGILDRPQHALDEADVIGR